MTLEGFNGTEVPRPYNKCMPQSLTLNDACTHDGSHPGVGVINNSCVSCKETGEEVGVETGEVKGNIAYTQFLVV